jgi:hypothetical protein
MGAMKVGLVGFSGAGKSTTFRWLTGATPDPGLIQKGQLGMAKVPDERLDYFSAKFKPKKTTYAEIAFLDTPGLLTEERKDNPKRLSVIREANGLLVVLDAFSGAKPAVALQKFREELLFADLEIVGNRVDKLKTQLKKPRPAKERELEQAEFDLVSRLAAALEAGQYPRDLGLKPDEEKLIRSFQLLTLKPELVFLNLGDGNLTQPLPADVAALSPGALQASPKLELELQELPTDEREMFMADLGLKESARTGILQAIFAGMNRIVFFTVGEDECRAWPLDKGADAVEGAGAIHTDLAKRFVRAEVVSCADFRRVGGIKEAKAAGVHRLEGKTYIVQDGDIMHIL